MAQLKAAATEKKPPLWYLTFLSQLHAMYCLLLRMDLPYSTYGCGYNWGIMSCRQRRKVGVLCQCNTKQQSIHHRAGLAADNLWNTMHRRQVCIWFDNPRRYRWGADPHSPDLTLSCTAVAVLHTTALPAYPGMPELAEIVAKVPKVADDTFRSHRALFDPIPLDIAKKDVRSLNWRPFFPSPLRSGTHKDLLQLVRDLSCVENRQAPCSAACGHENTLSTT